MWKVGDKAICVKNCSNPITPGRCPVKGEVFTVCGISGGAFPGWLQFKEISQLSNVTGERRAFRYTFFRKPADHSDANINVEYTTIEEPVTPKRVKETMSDKLQKSFGLPSTIKWKPSDWDLTGML